MYVLHDSGMEEGWGGENNSNMLAYWFSVEIDQARQQPIHATLVPDSQGTQDL